MVGVRGSGARARRPLPVTAAWLPVNALIHERPPLSRQVELRESFQEGSFREDLWDAFISTCRRARFRQRRQRGGARQGSFTSFALAFSSWNHFPGRANSALTSGWVS